jgi:hypothetical protein
MRRPISSIGEVPDAGEAVAQHRLINHELHGGRLRGGDTEAQPDAKLKGAGQPVDHHGSDQRDGVLQQDDRPRPNTARKQSSPRQ